MNRIHRTIRAAWEHPIVGVYFFVAFMSAILLAALVATSPPASAQGGGVAHQGAQRTYNRIAGILDPWSTLTFRQGEAQLVVHSSHDEEDNLAGGITPEDSSTMSAHWRSKHMDLEVKCPRLRSDGPGDEGNQVQAARLARMVASLQAYFPPDGTMAEIPDFCPVFELDELVPQELPPLGFCSGARL